MVFICALCSEEFLDFEIYYKHILKEYEKTGAMDIKLKVLKKYNPIGFEYIKDLNRIYEYEIFNFDDNYDLKYYFLKIKF